MSREAITEKGLWGDVREEIRTDGTITWAMCTEGGQFQQTEYIELDSGQWYV